MKRSTVRWLMIRAAGACAIAGLLPLAAIPSRAAPQAPDSASEEKEACIANLKAIYQAIQAFQADHKDLPNWLSDLVPQYLPDANVLICPVCRRTGETEAPPLADPKIAASYLFEFCPVPLDAASTNAPIRTRRDWKRRQMGLVGSAVPIVRCRHHRPVLNLGFDGVIYESPTSWELAFTNRVSLDSLMPSRLFANESPPAPKPQARPHFPARDPNAGPELLDLTGYYNAALTDSWHGGTGNNLAALPTGLQTFAGVEFDVRGIVQLGSKSPSASKYPAEIKGIQVRRKCQRLHFLHAAAFGNAADDGKQLGACVVHYATNQMRLEIPIVYGREVRNWHSLPDEPPGPKELKVIEGAKRQKTPNEIALDILLAAFTIIFLMVCVTLLPFSLFSVQGSRAGNTRNGHRSRRASLSVSFPTTIGRLSAVGIAGMDRMIRHNVIATSGRAVEAAGDVNVLLSDETGTVALSAIAWQPNSNLAALDAVEMLMASLRTTK